MQYPQMLIKYEGFLRQHIENSKILCISSESNKNKQYFFYKKNHHIIHWITHFGTKGKKANNNTKQVTIS